MSTKISILTILIALCINVGFAQETDKKQAKAERKAEKQK